MTVLRFFTALTRALGAGVVLSLGALTTTPAVSMTVTPLVVEMSTAGSASKATLRIANDSTAPLPIEIKVYRLEVGEGGESETAAAPDDFLIFPAHALIPPGGSQAVRVQWVGRGDIRRSQSYLFKVSQIPVKFPETKSGVQFTFHFTVLVNVSPPGAVSLLALKDVAIEAGPQGAKYPAITVVNEGSRHARLGNATLTLSGAGWSTTISVATMRQMVGVGMVQPGKRRRFVLTDQLLPAGTKGLTGSLDYRAGEADTD